MRSPSTRSSVMSGTAIAVAVLWGAVEFIALFWSRFSGRSATPELFRTP
jgi:hypothetical protein